LRRAVPFLGILPFLIASPTFSATWTVSPDGFGDFPTIEAAIGAAGDGDVIELADGTFTGDGNRDLYLHNEVLTLRSQSGNPTQCVLDAEGGPGVTRRVFTFQGTGPGFVIENLTIARGTALDELSSVYGGGVLLTSGASPTFTGCIFTENQAHRGGALFGYDASAPSITACLFVDNHATSYGGAISLNADCFATFDGCLFTGNTSDYAGGALNLWNGAAPEFTNCTFHGNSAGDAGAVAWCRWGGAPTFVSSILAFSTSGATIVCDGGDGYPTLSCCDVYGNTGGDWTDCIAGMEASDGNLSVDPLFCDAPSGDFALQWGSACLTAHSGGCGQIGAWGPGNCPSAAVESSSWGQVKSPYR
jgi:hypothetical protein